ncbi:MAG: flagellar motor switch protein FliG [Chromatiaceae bacterium]|nr:flagellar motor switch protein FliG [Lamprobacter modestohalophilus]MCF7979553.1 flagellar motor switch protein FliG [Chromatiaceae bacterium]MCF7994576.1 flagellar motor switch protein FliG [Chromatiaceae bacterium]MCF8004396.1 flagellar motor switch protein FliG [Chromatiaceae bacterium]MCF8014085.1 flagellar motor switch protein FliG [Chromatiaceae bacterium]
MDANSKAILDKMSGARRSAILMLALDDESAAEVFKRMAPQEVQEVSTEMTKLDQVSHAEMNAVLDAFQNEQEEFVALNLNSSDHIRSVLSMALGEERAASLLEDIFEHKGGSGIDSLNLMEASMVSELIRDEHPQIIATVLVHLERRQAAAVLELFDDKLRNDVVLRIATFSGVQPAALQELTEVLTGMLDGQTLKRSKMGGVRTAAEILNMMNTTQEEAAIETVRAHSEDLAQKIIDEMFLFENLIELDDRSIQLLLKEIDTDSLVVALKGAPENLVEAFLRNMSSRASEMIREDMEARGPMRVSQVEAEQKAILQVARRLSESGEIIIGGADDNYV